MNNTLYYGDNLTILKDHIEDCSVDLIYLDPPFNSNRDYNVLFREKSGHESPSQIEAFGDTWNWAGAASAWYDFQSICPVPKLYELMHGLKNAIGENDVMAYLVMMAPRLYQLHRVLKPTGSLYLHCDPTAGHYLKLILDCIFSPRNFVNEIVWRRYGAHNDVGQGSKHFGRVHDTIFFYSKTSNVIWNQLFMPLNPEYIADTYRSIEEETGRRYMTTPLTGPGGEAKGNPVFEWNGHTRAWRYSKATMQRLHDEGKLHYSATGYVRQKKYLEDSKGVPVQDEWTDISSLSGQHRERLGFPTQKPIALLERIILSSSNEGDIILDPFCGCGTAIIAAEKHNRKWIGIDITSIATTLVQKRLYDSFHARDVNLVSDEAMPTRIPTFEVKGLPKDVTAARELYEKDPLHKDFEMWAVSLIPAFPCDKKGADGGIDGIAYFKENDKKSTKAVVQVKGGHPMVAHIQDLRGVMAREKAKMGFFITLEKPTNPMMKEALFAEYYQPESGVGKRVQALQIRSIEELLNGREFDIPLTGSNVSLLHSGVIRGGALQKVMKMNEEEE